MQTQMSQQRAASVRHRRQRRNITAWTVKGATEFSSDSVLSNPVAVIEFFQRFAPAACLSLMNGTTPQRYSGQPGVRRMDGSWGLVFLAHIMTGNPDWQNWYHDWQDSRLWEVCGFERTPSWMSVWTRFSELEHPRYVAAFTDAANRFIRVAARHESRAFQHFHIDGTAAHSHAKLEHACPTEAYCESRIDRAVKHVGRASDETVSGERHEKARQPEPENPDEEPALPAGRGSSRVQYLTDEDAQALGLADWQHSRYLTFGQGGHIYRCRDKYAGVRAYVNANPRRSRKAWTGAYFLPAIDDFFWAPTAVHFFDAGVQEHKGWPALHRKLMTALNDDPDNPTHEPVSVVADRGFANPDRAVTAAPSG